LQKLRVAADATGITLYQANLRTYQLLCYGVSVPIAAGKPNDQVQLIDWEHPENNHFALAEEVTLRGHFERWSDLVIYLNGIAVGVIELKRGSAEVNDGVRQLTTNQGEIFLKGFFSTVQLVFAGNDSQGLRYGTVTTSEQFFVDWKSTKTAALTSGALLDRHLAEICEKSRLLDLIRNFVLFGGVVKKVPRHYQFMGSKAPGNASPDANGARSGIPQGSGRNILKVLFAKWLLEQDPEARILIVTDRDELEKQIESVRRNSGSSEKTPYRRGSSRERNL
jgi:type I restriction enzyme, R subunit